MAEQDMIELLTAALDQKRDIDRDNIAKMNMVNYTPPRRAWPAQPRCRAWGQSPKAEKTPIISMLGGVPRARPPV
jgi:hypothetical protein